MRRQLRPSIDGLETKALLSTLVGPPVMLAPPIAPPHQATTAGLTVSLTTNQSTYSVGQVATITETITNTSNQAVTFEFGPSIDGVYVTHNNAVVWRSNEGPTPMFIVLRTLQPGQSVTLQAQWKVSGAAGTYAVHSQMDPEATVAFGVTSPTNPSVLRK
jgi:hypothetical protein